MKQCTVCAEEKPLDEFALIWKGKERRQSRCRSCMARFYQEKRKARKASGLCPSCGKNDPGPEHKTCSECREKNILWDRTHPGRRSLGNVPRLYGLSVAAFEEMRATQGNRCAICGATSDQRLHVDHCHQTGTVRGLLCGECNLGLGKFRDQPELLRLAASYLEAAGATPAALH